MISDLLTLKGVALSKYGSIQSFANALAWNRNKAKRILDGKQEPSPSEICSMAEVLGVDSYQAFISLFFPSLSTKWTSGGTTTA